MSTAPTAAAAKVTVTETSPADIGDVAEQLLSLRDGQHRDVELVRDYLWGLDPTVARGWLARVDGEPAGFTMLYLRQMHWPRGEQSGATEHSIHSGEIITAGYWAHLYVRPEFRAKMIYPQLVLAMIRGMKTAGIQVIFSATRQPTVAEGHQKLGFALVGAIPLRFTPLQPFKLLAKQKNVAALAPLGKPLDAAYWLAKRRRVGSSANIEVLSPDSGAVDAIVELLNVRRGGPVRQQWTPELFRRRYRATLDGQPYRITAIHRDCRIVAAVVLTFAERGNRIHAGILLETVFAADATDADIRWLLADAHRYAVGQGAEIMLGLPDSLSLPQSSAPSSRYLTSGSENYHLLVYPKTMAQPPLASSELANWLFSFGDHDAF